MSDIKLDTETDDLVFENGDLVLTTGADSIRQNVQQRLRTFRGEWFLDLSAGVPWFQDILKKNPNPNVVDGVLKNVILSTPGVIELTSFELEYEPALRQLTVDFSVLSTEGEIDFSENVGA